jgi:hypothetical protein
MYAKIAANFSGLEPDDEKGRQRPKELSEQ